jgi:hypothetical protein
VNIQGIKHVPVAENARGEQLRGWIDVKDAMFEVERRATRIRLVDLIVGEDGELTWLGREDSLVVPIVDERDVDERDAEEHDDEYYMYGYEGEGDDDDE